MKMLGIDYGRKHVGLAVTDDEGNMAFPFKTLEVVSRKRLFEDLEKIVEYEGVRKVVVGLPLTMKGEEGAASSEVQKFICDIEEYLNVPVDFIDERLSSREAEGHGHRQGGEHAAAAQILLETYLRQKKVP